MSDLSLPHGKVPVDVLEKIVFTHLGAKRKDVVRGPSVGEDAAVLHVGNDHLLVASSDPITGAIERIGWLAVHVSANDVATRGVRPRWYLSCILLPETSNVSIVEKICGQIDEAAEELGVAVVGGHAEITPGLTQPIVVGCIMGVTEGKRYVTSSGAKPGDKIILTKGAGIEGTAILASDRREILTKKLGVAFVQRAGLFFNSISVVDEALIAFNAGGVSAMHDPTEGGVAGGLNEVADASKTGFYVFEEKIPIAPETSAICSFFDIDPLQLISSGALLIMAEAATSDRIVSSLEKGGVKASVIGEVTKSSGGRLIECRDGSVNRLARPFCDHLWLALARK